MKRLNSDRLKLMLVGFVAGIVFGGGRAKADFTWARKADMPVKNMQPSTNVVGSKIYVIGGWHAIGELNPQWKALTRVDVYDPTTDTWTRKADMPTGRGHTNACVVDGKICVIGGDSGPGDSPIPTVEVYDLVTDSWTQKDDMPTRRRWFSTCVVDGIIYVIGGNPGSGGTHLKTVEAYDTTTDTWTTKADMFTGRSFLSTCVVDGLIYAIGGGAPGTSAVEVYDPSTDTWTKKADMPTARYGLDTVVVNGKIYAIGGWYFSLGGPIYSTVEVYDLATDTWTKGVDISVTTAMHSTSVVEGKIYVFGGATATHDNNNWILTSAVYVNEPIVDFNGDGIVDAADMCILVDHWGEEYSLCDISPMPWGDGVVDVEDLKVLAGHLFEEVDDPTLIAHWPLDEAEGMVVADGAGGNDGYALGDPVWLPEGGQFNGALQLDGVDDYVVTGTAPTAETGAYSVLAWMKGGAPGQVVLSQLGKANWLCADPSEGALMTELTVAGRDSCSLGSQTCITNGNLHRIGFVWDGSYRRLYVDGVIVAEDAQDNLDISSNGLYFGTGKTMEPGTFFSGLIDEIRIYNRPLSP